MTPGIPWTLDELRLAVDRTDLKLDDQYSRFLLSGALKELERLEAASAGLVRALNRAPGTTNVVHTITLQHPLPALNVGDSILFLVVPPKQQSQES